MKKGLNQRPKLMLLHVYMVKWKEYNDNIMKLIPPFEVQQLKVQLIFFNHVILTYI